MKTLEQYYNKLTTEMLIKIRSHIQTDIEEDDGRLTAHSSYDLDYNLDKRDTIDDILLKRLADKVLSKSSGASKTEPAPFNPIHYY